MRNRIREIEKKQLTEKRLVRKEAERCRALHREAS